MAKLARRVLTIVAALLLPSLLVWSSLRTFRSLSDLRTDYLRSRAAAIAGRLEALQSSEDVLSAVEQDAGPDLADLQVYSRQLGSFDPAVAAILEGRELYRTERLSKAGTHLYRTYVPFHIGGVMYVARIDLDEASADALLTPARHNVVVATVSGLAIMLLAAYVIWNARRSAEIERRQLQLEHLARLGEMSAVLAHEIRNPLGTMKGFVQLAQEQATGAVRGFLEPVLEETSRLERLVSDLLLYGRGPKPSAANVNWSDLGPALQAMSDSNRITVDPNECSFIADPDLVKQILINLVRNATESGAQHVRVYPERTNADIRICVEDDGSGISDDILEKVFRPFYTTKSSGTGLGLPIAKQLAESMKGTLTISRRNPQGTLAVLTIPNGTNTYR